ncbi:MAG TPA: division/cell wall cluster transcriptional repressor MraZ [Oscillospiraceae bacterium]|nr:division/cell wall cluster transcriptional repressor MraZ [Oscillospiraceae bacterium]
MLIGAYEHMLDAKGRVFIPAKWRDSIGDALIVTPGLLETQSERCLFGMLADEWETFSRKLAALPVTDAGGQAIRRRLYSMAVVCEIDKQGRILIPAALREQAGLGKDVTLIGVGDRVEFWNPEELAAYSARSQETYGEALTHLAALGI